MYVFVYMHLYTRRRDRTISGGCFEGIKGLLTRIIIIRMDRHRRGMGTQAEQKVKEHGDTR
jgi:hypothetical protein